MSYYIDSPIGEIYFNSPNKLSVFLSQNSYIIRRRNISFIDENKFFEFSDFYQWISMNIIKMYSRYYLSIYLNDDTYEILDIYRRYKVNKNNNDIYSFLQ